MSGSFDAGRVASISSAPLCLGCVLDPLWVQQNQPFSLRIRRIIQSGNLKMTW